MGDHVPMVVPGVMHTENDRTNALGDETRENIVEDQLRDLPERR